MRTFKYMGNHKEDEAYMQKMCGKGYAAIRLVEGLWTFEQCEPYQYTYRMAYFRGKSKDEIDHFIDECAINGIEFVSRYSFWAIFRSEKPFFLYTRQEELEICEKIYRPMPVGAVLSWLFFVLSVFLSLTVSRRFLILTVAVSIYGFVCTRCAVSYKRLLKQLKKCS